MTTAALDVQAEAAGESTAPPSDPIRFHPRNPNRPADWRWRRAVLLVEGRIKRSRRVDDTWVLRAARFQATLRGCRDDGDHEALAEGMPDLYGAHSYFADPDPMRRWSLEARILSGESFEAIAGRFGIDAGVVTAFEKVYFDLVDRLDTDYVLLVAVGLHPGPTTPSLGSIWKWFGLHGGAHVLDFLLSTDTGPNKPESREQVGDFVHAHVRAVLVRKIAVGVMTLPVDGHSASKVLELFLRGLKDERHAPEPAPTLEAIRPNVTALWDGLPSFMRTGSPTAAPTNTLPPGPEGGGR